MNLWKKIPEQELIDELIANGIVKHGHFRLTSGRHSDTYIQKDEIILIPDLRRSIAEHFCKVIKPGISSHAEVIVGPIMGALPFASLVADRLQLPLIYPDQAFDESGIVLRRGFDKFIEGKTVFIIEDIVTTGDSFRELSSIIVHAGGEVAGVTCIWNRGDLIPNRGGNQYFSTIINKKIISYASNSCPLCTKGIPLIDPKTNKVIT